MKTTQGEPISGQRQREELKAFLRAMRGRLRPADVGLPDAGRRRTPGLRREEVAVLSGVGTSWYIQLEQGRNIKVSDSVLDAICRALRLDLREREHLYRLAGMNPPQPHVEETLNKGPLLTLLENWMPKPAHILDRRWNIVMMNASARAVFGYTDEDENCLEAFFVNQTYRSRYRDWESNAASLVAEFRRDAARFPDDSRFDRLVARLRAASPEFGALWERHEVAVPNIGVKTIDHPQVGELSFDHWVLQLPDRPDVRLVVHTPRAGTDTGGKLGELLCDGGR